MGAGNRHILTVLLQNDIGSTIGLDLEVADGDFVQKRGEIGDGLKTGALTPDQSQT